MKCLKYSVITSLLLTSCSSKEGKKMSFEETSSPNILFILADDMGIEALSAYNHNSSQAVEKAHTPNIDMLVERGVTFDNAWASPLSAPTRAAAITGKYGHRTGIVSLNPELSTSEKTLHASLSVRYANSLMELSGEAMSSYEDSYSFAGDILGDGTSERKYSFSEVICNGNPYTNAIRNKDHKLISVDGVPTEFLKIDGVTESEISPNSAQGVYNELVEQINKLNIPKQ